MNDFVVINCALNAPLMLVCTTGNTLLLAAIIRTPSLRKPSMIFLCCLAVTDLLVGLIVQPIYIAYELQAGALLTRAVNALFSLAGSVSLFTITAISVDRCLALYYHLRYPNLMNEKRALVTVVTLWSLGIALSSFTLLNRSFLVLAIGIAVCILISSFSYFRIYRIVRQHHLQIHSQQLAVQIQHLNLVRSMKSALNTFIYYICMILCYSPMFTFMLIVAVQPNLSGLTVWKVGNTFVFMNSSINPILFCWRLRELRVAVLKTIESCFKVCRRDACWDKPTDEAAIFKGFFPQLEVQFTGYECRSYNANGNYFKWKRRPV